MNFGGGFEALKNINLEVHEGELVVLLGANGAGKSTIFNTISGLIKITSGDIHFNGNNIRGSTPDRIVKAGVVQCAEGKKLFSEMSVQENLMMGGFVHRRKKAQLKQSLEETYDLFPILKSKKDDAAASLSGGQQQMLAIGRAMMSKPKLLMLDEPSMGLAPLLVEEVFEIIQRLNEQGTTILLVEQNAQMALSIAHRGYVLETGRIVTSAPAKDLLNDDAVRKAYLGG